MYVCILGAAGQVLVHRNVPSRPEAFLEIVAPYREDLVVAAECMFTWYWLADVCAAETMLFVLGHALAMKAIHGGKAKNDKIDTARYTDLAQWSRHEGVLMNEIGVSREVHAGEPPKELSGLRRVERTD